MAFSLGDLFTAVTFLCRKTFVGNTLLLILEICPRGFFFFFSFVHSFFLSQVLSKCHILIPVLLSIVSGFSLQGFFGDKDIKSIVT